jgi:hypothetical protein
VYGPFLITPLPHREAAATTVTRSIPYSPTRCHPVCLLQQLRRIATLVATASSILLFAPPHRPARLLQQSASEWPARQHPKRHVQGLSPQGHGGQSEGVVEGNRQQISALDSFFKLGGDEEVKRSRGSLKFVIAVGEAWRTTPGGGNNCGEDESVLGTPFIWQRWCAVAHLGIESTSIVHALAIMRVHSLQLPGVVEYKPWIGESLWSSRLEEEASRTWWHRGGETVMSLGVIGNLCNVSELMK